MPPSSKTYQTVSIDECIAIHKALVNQAGTSAEIRDFALLHSAIERPNATYDGIDLYPNIFHKAAALLQSLCLNHPFTDGNKRTAWTTTKRLLFLNGYHLSAKEIEGADFLVYVDTNKPDIKLIMTWLKSHSKKV